MNNQSLLQTGLLLHIIGMAILAGVTLVGSIMSRQFWVQYQRDQQKGFAVMQATARLPAVTGTGLLLQIISGMIMLAATGGAYGEQLWFRVKMIFVLLIIAGSVFLKRRLEKRLRKLVFDDTHGNRTGQIGKLVARISYLYLFLLCFFVIIFVLSAFRFQ